MLSFEIDPNGVMHSITAYCGVYHVAGRINR